MYPRNAASPPEIGVGAVVQISDGAVQTSGVSISVKQKGGSPSSGGGAIAYGTGGCVFYTPTQAETNTEEFIVEAYKTACFPISQTVITTAINVAGRVDVGSIVGTGQTGADLGAGLSAIKGAGFSGTTDSLEKIRDRVDTLGATASSPAADKAYTLSWTRTVGDNDGGSSSDTTTVNGTSFITGETTGTTLLEVDGTVTADNPLETPRAIQLWSQYTGGSPHALVVKAYNAIDTTWEPLGNITNTSEITSWVFYLSSQHINTSTGQIQIKVVHNTASGNPAHAFSIDKGLLLASSAVDALTVENISDGVWDEIISPSQHNVKNSAAYKLWRNSETMIWTGLATGGTANTVVLPEGDSAEAVGAYDPAMVYIIAGTGVGQTRLCVQYSGHPDHVLVVDRDWKVIPDATSEVIIMAHAGREHVNEGQAQGGTIGTITLNANASASDDAYNAQVVFLRSGTGQDQARRVLDYDGTTKVAIVSRDWAVVPDATTGYVMLPSGAISDNCIGRAVWSDQIGDYAAIPGSSAEALIAARDNASLGAQTISEGLFALFQGCKDWGPIISASFTGTFQPGGYLEVRYTFGLGSGGGDPIGSFDENGTWTTDPGYAALNTKNAILRVDAGNVATAGIITINYVSLLDNAEHRWVSRVPAVIDCDECWNLREDGRLRPCDAGTLLHTFDNEELVQDLFRGNYYRCDGWSGDTDPILTFGSNKGEVMAEATQDKYCVQYICLDDPTFDENMLGYWSTWNGWQQELAPGKVVPPNSIMCFCPDGGGPGNTGSIAPRMLDITPMTPTGRGYNETSRLFIGEMVHAFGSGTKYCFGSDGVMKALNLYPTATAGGDNNAYFETVLDRLLEQKVEGSIVTVAPSTIDAITLHQNNDYPEFELTLGPQWSPYLDGTYTPFLTIKEEIVGGETLSEATGTIIDQGLGTLAIPLTKDNTNLMPKKYMWQVQLRKPNIDPDLPPLAVKVAASGTLHIRPTLKPVGTSAVEEPATLAPMISVTAAYTILPTDYYILASGTLTLTLPSSIGLAGKLFRIKNTGTGVIAIEPILSQTIDGQINKSLMNQYDAIKLVSDGANWAIF